MKERKLTKLKYFTAGAAVALTAAFLIIMLVFILPYSSYVDDPTSLNAQKKTREIMGYINSKFMGEVNDEQLADYMYLGLVSGLEDPYSTYFTKDEYTAVSRRQQGEYKGIGIKVATREEDGRLEITFVAEDGPAMRAGIKEGDLILTVNGEDYSSATAKELSSYIKSLEEDSVELTVYREETQEELTFDLTMEELEDEIVKYRMLEDGIGYIYITSFTANTAEQFQKARNDLEEQGMTSLIVDLRDNTGGLVSSVKDLLCSFMPEGLLFYTEDKDGDRKEFFSEGTNVLDIPMAVLVNKNTASASEIFSGAVQDTGMGTIIGTETYGKGIVQNSYTLNDGSVLRITVSHYYTPNGNDIHGQGITPDIEVENEEGEDSQLLKAVEVLKS